MTRLISIRSGFGSVAPGLLLAIAAPAQAQDASQQLIASGTATLEGSGAKAMTKAEGAAQLEAAKFAWNKLRVRAAFSASAMRFTPDQNLEMARGLLEVCNVTRVDSSVDKATRTATFSFGFDCATQDILSRVTDIRARAEAARANDLDAAPHDQVVYLFLSRRITDMAASYSDGTNYRSSQKSFELVSAQALEDGLVSRMSGVGIAAVSYADLLGAGCASTDIADVNREFSVTPPGQSDYGITSETRAAIIAAVRECGVKYLALGSADVGVTGRDPSGRPLGRVTVSAQVLDIRQRLPVSIARVRTVADAAANEEIAAEEAAMAKAAADVGVKLVEQVKLRGIQ